MSTVHISTNELRPGMYIIPTDALWPNRPFLYSKGGFITSRAEIEDIIAQGYIEAFYDPDKSYEEPAETFLAEQALQVPIPPKIPLDAEIKPAETLYTNSVEHMEHFFDEARHGQIKTKPVQHLVSHLLGSMDRNQDALTSLAKIKSYHEYTFTHCLNVAIFALAFGRQLNLAPKELELLGMAALFHDLGKTCIPKRILDAPRKLTHAEFAIIQTHSQHGATLLQKVPSIPKQVIQGVLDHHEKYNGHGYPNHKKGGEISAFGQIISVADVYDALSADRAYRTAISPNNALATMYGMRDTWQPGLCETFIKTLGIYPVGSCVRLTMGYIGIVSQSNFQAPLYPTVILCIAPDGSAINPPQKLDLATQHDLQILRVLPSSTIDVTLTDLL